MQICLNNQNGIIEKLTNLSIVQIIFSVKYLSDITLFCSFYYYRINVNKKVIQYPANILFNQVNECYLIVGWERKILINIWLHAHVALLQFSHFAVGLNNQVFIYKRYLSEMRILVRLRMTYAHFQSQKAFFISSITHT